MSAVNQFNKSKRGQFGFDIADIFSYLGYFIAVLIIILILSLPSCLTRIDTDRAESKLQEKTEAMALIKADAQLTSYLRTQMPGKDELLAKLNWLEQHKNMPHTSTFDPTTGISVPEKVKIDVEKAKGFLNNHPEVYVDRDYSEFISGLHAVYAANGKEKGNVEMTFKVVTAAMFLRGVGDGKKAGGYLYYLYPLAVDLQNRNPGAPGKDGDYDFTIGITPSEIFQGRMPVQAMQVVPLADSTLAKVRLTYYQERSSWLQQP